MILSDLEETLARQLGEAESRANKYEQALRDTVKPLEHALGMIVEFGDLNGFRNMTDQELGSSVIAVAKELSATLDSTRAALDKTEGK